MRLETKCRLLDDKRLKQTETSPKGSSQVLRAQLNWEGKPVWGTPAPHALYLLFLGSSKDKERYQAKRKK
jgi:hypothetical protein